ncbi:hypothetical protein [Lysobacter sp. Root604]|uniref:hypothetical protein n=1 Tax=Lysobacter sp. Root604 TaxID=1736568 RepID=UPI0006FBC9BC|nr:hypothetical protein [Lysobacter sp. Root604]KRA17728.1 hypothetical protein ASD69_13750 [Lysobacter sp. Root604]
MAIRAERILVTTGALAIVAILATAVWASLQVAPPSPARAAWLSMPPESEFDGGANARGALLAASPMLGELPHICGREDHAQDEERYVALFDPGGFKPYYRADFSIRDSNASIAIELESRGLMGEQPLRMHARRLFHADTKELEGIRRTWQDPTLWRTPQLRTSVCVSGGNIMQSCVRGRYTLSRQHCNSPAHQALKAAIQAKFPLPPSGD